MRKYPLSSHPTGFARTGLRPMGNLEYGGGGGGGGGDSPCAPRDVLVLAVALWLSPWGDFVCPYSFMRTSCHTSYLGGIRVAFGAVSPSFATSVFVAP